MKKIYAIALLSLAGLVLSTGPAAACWCRHARLCGRCCTTICVKQYNAFSPFCYGNFTCSGCCPSMCGGCQAPCCQNPGCQGPCCFNQACGYPGCCGVACGDGCDASGMDHLPVQYPVMNQPSAAAPIFSAPVPTATNTPGPMSALPGSEGMPQGPVQPTAYYPVSNPASGAPMPASAAAAAGMASGSGNAFASQGR